MHTKISVLTGIPLSQVRNSDALILPVDNMLNIKTTKAGKEVSEADGGNIPLVLHNIRRNFTINTGKIEYPYSSCLILKTSNFNSKYIFVTVVANPSKDMTKGDKEKCLYDAYTNILTSAVTSNSKRLAIPLLGVESKGYEENTLVFSMISALSDFIQANNYLDEVCIVTPKKKESDLVTYWLHRVATTFGLSGWWLRESTNFNENNLIFEEV